MTMIHSITPKGITLPDGIISPDHPSVDGAMAIFDAIMVAVADWHGSDQDDTDMKTKAENVASQIMSDDSLKSFLNDANKAELLPVITNLLHHTDIETYHQISSLNQDSGNIQQQISAVFETPIANKTDPDITHPDHQPVDFQDTDKPAPLSGLITEYSHFQLPKSVSHQSRGQYETAKNPVQILASLIRKTEGKSFDDLKPKPVQTVTFKPDAPASETIQIDELIPISGSEMEPAPEPVTSIASQPQLRSWHPPLSADVTDHSTRYGPFPKTTVQIHTGKEASINHANVPMAEIPMAEIDNENTGSNESILTDMKKGAVPASKGEYASIKQVISDNRTADMLPIRNRPTENAPLSDDTTIMASAIKSKPISSVSPLQHVPVSPSSSAMTLAPMTDIEHHGSFSGQQHNGQQNNQQNPQQGQADPMLDTRMSLDQGKDGRLLRLNINDANWTDRLLRNIQSNPVKGSDETIQVILEPAKLGRLVVQISITGNNTNVQITSATAEAAAILADAEPRLQQVFEQHGLKLGQMQTSMGQGFSNQWSQGQGSSSSERNNKTGTKNATQDEEQSTKILENDKTGQVNILA